MSTYDSTTAESEKTTITPVGIHPEMAPISGISPLFKYTSPPRKVMLGGNLTQTNVVVGATRKRLRSGFEREHAKGTYKHMFDRDSIVLAVIPRFTAGVLNNKRAKNPMDLVIIEDFQTKQLSCITLNKYHIMHQHYGFNYNFDEDVLDKLHTPGAKFEAGSIIANSPNVTPDGDYMLGLEANIVFNTDPVGSEDGIGMSRSFAGRISTSGFETRTFSCGRTHYPINWNGNSETYKAIPDIGDTIRSNGLIAAFRPFNPILDPVYMTARKLMTPAYGMDVLLYGIAGARVVDVKVLHNERNSDDGLPNEFTDQLRKYYEAEKEYYMKVLKTVMQRTGKRLSDTVDLHPDLWEVVHDAIKYCGMDLVKAGLWSQEDSARLQNPRAYRGESLDEWRVEITFEYSTEIAEGPKLTNMSGSKGVAVAIWPDECMPVDKFGNRADVIFYGGSTISRMTVAQLHEQTIGATGRDVIKRLRRAYGFGDFEQLQYNDIFNTITNNGEGLAREQYEYLLGWYKIISTDTDYPRALHYLTSKGRWIEHLAHVIEDGNDPYGTYIHIPPQSCVRMDEVITAIKDSKYMPEMSTVKFRWPDDTEYTETVSPILIGPTYFLPLEKTATDWSGVSSSKVGHFGTTARLTQSDKYSKPGRETGTRTSGESEKRNLAKSMGGENLAHIADMNNNPVVHRVVCRTIITADQPTNIEEVVNREEYPLGGHRPLSFVKHMHLCSGKGFSRE